MSGVQQTTFEKRTSEYWEDHFVPEAAVWMADWKKHGLSRCNIYIIAPEGTWPSKVGIAVHARKRLNGIQTSHWKRLQIPYCWWAENTQAARKVEAKTHEMLAVDERQLLGEWFDMHPDQVAEVVQFAALTVGVEISGLIPEPEIVADIQRSVGELRHNTKLKRAERRDNETFMHLGEMGSTPEQRWARAERDLQKRGKRGKNTLVPS